MLSAVAERGRLAHTKTPAVITVEEILELAKQAENLYR